MSRAVGRCMWQDECILVRLLWGLLLLLSLFERRTHITLLSEKESITSEVGSLELLGCRNSSDKDASGICSTHTCVKVEISNGINQSSVVGASTFSDAPSFISSFLRAAVFANTMKCKWMLHVFFSEDSLSHSQMQWHTHAHSDGDDNAPCLRSWQRSVNCSPFPQGFIFSGVPRHMRKQINQPVF